MHIKAVADMETIIFFAESDSFIRAPFCTIF